MNLGPFFCNFVFMMPWIFNYLVWILPLCMGGITIVETEESMKFFWNASNPKFSNENGAQISIPVRYNLAIYCPYNVSEYYKIYWVPEFMFKECFIPANATATVDLFLDCDSPNEARYFEINILPFNGVPWQKDFKIGKSFYLATMSSGTRKGINQTYKGACDDFNMKLNLTVIPKPLPTTKAPPDNTKIHTTRRPSSVRTTPKLTTTSTTPETTTRRPATTKKPTTKLKTTSRPPSTDIPDINSGDIVIDGSNNGIIDASSGQSLTFSYLLVLSICLSVINLVQVTR